MAEHRNRVSGDLAKWLMKHEILFLLESLQRESFSRKIYLNRGQELGTEEGFGDQFKFTQNLSKKEIVFFREQSVKGFQER